MRRASASPSRAAGVTPRSARRGFPFPLLADFEPKGAVGRAYGVSRLNDSYHHRAFSVLDREGTVRRHRLSILGSTQGPVPSLPGSISSSDDRIDPR